MKGMKKRKKTELKTSRASAMKPVMLSKMIQFVKKEEGRLFSKDFSKWFQSFSTFTAYAMARCEEILLFKFKCLELKNRVALDNDEELLDFYRYKLEDRKTDDKSAINQGTNYEMYIEEDDVNLCAKQHLTDWLKYVKEEKGHQMKSEDVIFPKIGPIPRNVNNNNRDLTDSRTGLENCEIKWGENMSVQKVIDILNIITGAMLRDETFLEPDSFIRQCFDGVWFTTHAIRRGFAQSKFFNGNDSWSLTFLKFWCGWSEQHSYDVIMKYLLEEVTKQEEDVFAGGRAPDRRRMMSGCPSNWQQRTVVNHSSSTERATTMSIIGNQVEQILEILSSNAFFSPQDQAAAVALSSTVLPEPFIPEQENNSAYPSDKKWETQVKWWYFPEPEFHVFKPLKDLSVSEKSTLKCVSRHSRLHTIVKGFECFLKSIDNMVVEEDNINNLLRDYESFLKARGHLDNEIKNTRLNQMVKSSSLLLSNI